MSRLPRGAKYDADRIAALAKITPRKHEATPADVRRVITHVRSLRQPIRASAVARTTGLHTHVVHGILTEAARHGYVHCTSRKWDRWTRGPAEYEAREET